jgi:predicted permease
VDPWVRKRLEPRRLASGAVFGVVIGAVSVLMAGSKEGPRIVFYIGIALAIALIAPWILSVLYLLTQRGRAARRDRRLR